MGWRPHAIATWIVLAVAAGLRLHGLGSESLWNDELSTWSRLQPGPFDAEFWVRTREDVHPPGFFLFMSAWVGVFGDGEVALRLPAALCGIAAVWACGRLATRVFDADAGVVAALLAAVSPLLIRFSQEARAYSAIALTSVLAADALVRLARDARPAVREAAGPIAWVALWLAASAYLHYSGLLAALTLGGVAFLWLALFDRPRLPLLVAALAGAALLYLPWGVSGFVGHLQAGGLGYLRTPELEDLLRVPQFALPLWAFVLALLYLAVSGGPAPGRDGRERADGFGPWLLLGWLLVLVLGVWTKSRVSSPIFNERNLIVAVPPLLVLMAGAITAPPRALRSSLAFAGLLASLVVADFVWRGEYYAKLTKHDFRGAASYAARWSEANPEARLVSHAWSAHYFEYYLRRAGVEAPLADTRTPRALFDELDAALREGPVIVMYGHKIVSPGMETEMRRRYRVKRFKRLKGAGAVLLLPRRAPDG